MTTPAYKDLTAEQRDELRAIYASISSLHHLTFEECLVDPCIRICLWNVNRARKKARARKAVATEIFELRP